MNSVRTDAAPATRGPYRRATTKGAMVEVEAVSPPSARIHADDRFEPGGGL